MAINCTSVSNSVLQLTPQLEYSGSDIDETNGWVELSWAYTASGGESYIIIGNYKDDNNTSYTCVNENAFNPYSYYYIDDVSVELGACSAPCNLDVSIQSTQEDCVEGGTADLTAVASNGSGNYSYDWSGNGNSSTLTDGDDGTYTVTVTDLNSVGCSSTETITIDILDPITAEAGPNDTICKSEGAELNASGGATYAWNTGDNGATLNVAPGATTTYNVTVTGSNGCTDTDQATVVVYDIPAVLVEMADQSVCQTSGPVSLTATPSGGSFYGPGVSGASFNPATAGLGYHTVWYEFGEYEDCLGADSVHFTVELCTGINDALTEKAISVYPNPATEQFVVEFNLNEELTGTIELLDVLGKSVATPVRAKLKGLKQSFDTSRLTKGVYFLRVSTETESINRKILLE